MSSREWKTYKLGEVAEVQTGPFGSQLHAKDYVAVGIPVIMPLNIEGGHVSTEKITRVKNKDAERLSRHIVKPGDIVFSRRGDVDKHAFIQEREKGWLCGTGCLKVSCSSEVNAHFISYQLNLDSKKEWLRQHAVGTTMPNLNTTILSNLPITLPPLSTQRHIADILSALDDKIELNRQTNATLEAMAQAIFREWFVNFNYPDPKGLSREHAPLQAKESGKQGGRLAEQTFRVSDMVESELGMIPQGWQVGKLGEICEFAYGKGLKSENRIEGEFPVVGSNGVVGSHSEYLVEGPGIVIGRKGTIGEVTWLHQDFFPIDTTFYIKDLLGVKALYFHYFLLKEQDFKKTGSDSAVPGLNRNQAYDNLVAIPSLEAVNQFNEKMVAIFEKIHNNEQQSATLASLRDVLLPKLMSGEITLN